MASTDDPRPPLSRSQRACRSERRFGLWSLAWSLSFLAVSLIVKFKWLPFPAIVAAALSTSLLGIGTVLAYRRFLRESDELRRKIEVEALALAFGVGVIGEATHFLLWASGAVPAYSSSLVLAGMVLTYSVAVLVKRRRYS